MKMIRYLLFFVPFFFLHAACSAQNDTIPAIKKAQPKDKPYKVDSAARKFHDPKKATLYSTFFPGLGQIYNRKYWKAPIVWAAVGIPAYLYFNNKSWYQKAQRAISLLDIYTLQGKPYPAGDSLKLIVPQLQPAVVAGDDNSLRSYRNEARKDQDYSLLFFLLFWGLNVVDATVDAHLAGFDISNSLSFNLQQPSGAVTLASPMGSGMGVSLVFDWHKARYKRLPAP